MSTPSRLNPPPRLNPDEIAKKYGGEVAIDPDEIAKKYGGEVVASTSPQPLSPFDSAASQAESIGPPESFAHRLGRNTIGQLPTIGATVGGLAGGVSGLGIGSIPGAVAGATLGAGVGEGARQIIGRYFPGLSKPPKSATEGALEQVKQMAYGGISEATAGPVINGIARVVSPLLRRSAGRALRAVMDPTGSQAEGEALRASERILERGGFVSPTRRSLERKAESEIERLSPTSGLIAAEEDLIKTQDIELRPIMTGLNNLRRELHMPVVPTTTGGAPAVPKVGAEPQIKAIDNLIAHIQANSMNGTFVPGRTISRESLRLIRQRLDKLIGAVHAQSARLQAGAISPEISLVTDTTRDMSNVLRDVLNKDAPHIAELNAEFSLWKSVKDAMSPTSLRAEFPKPNSPWTQLWHTRYAMWLAGAGAAGGAGYHIAGTEGAAYAIGALFAVNQLMSSTAWKTTSAAVKNRIADDLARGAYEEVATLAGRMMTMGNTQSPPSQREQ